MNMKKSHLTLDDQLRIETLISESNSIRYIADRLDKLPSTISREIRKHVKTTLPRCCDCTLSSSCTLHHVCGNQSYKKNAGPAQMQKSTAYTCIAVKVNATVSGVAFNL